MTTSSPHLTAALEYAKRGWSVFPLHAPVDGACSCGSVECGSVGKHPRTHNGLKAATANEASIRAWWAKWPDANIGIATGSSGLLVLDVDDKVQGAGSASLAALEREHGALPSTLSCSTGCGRHLYFRHPSDPIHNSTGKIGNGLDVRADGGYVVAPPSVHSTGNVYRWNDPSLPIADLPEWLLNLMCGGGPQGASEQNPVPLSDLLPIGSRNDSLTRIAGRLRAQGMRKDDIEASLLETNATGLEEPLPLAEVRGIAASMARYSPRRQGLAWFQFYPGDWFASNTVRFGRDYQRGWYIQLFAECWRRGGMLPDDPAMLWRWAGADSKETFERDKSIVLSEFELLEREDGTRVLVHPWMVDHYVKQAKKYQQKCDASAKSVLARKGRSEDMGTNCRAEPHCDHT